MHAAGVDSEVNHDLMRQLLAGICACSENRTVMIDPSLHRIVAAQPYSLWFATISGAHHYGFPSSDSDFDLRGAHVLPLAKVIGLVVRDEIVHNSRVNRHAVESLLHALLH